MSQRAILPQVFKEHSVTRKIRRIHHDYVLSALKQLRAPYGGSPIHDKKPSPLNLSDRPTPAEPTHAFNAIDPQLSQRKPSGQCAHPIRNRCADHSVGSLLDRICPILESLPRVSRRSLPPRGAASVIASYLPEQSAQVPPIFNGLRYAHPGLHPRPSSPTSGVVKRAFIFACVRVSPRHSSASRVKPTCRLSLLPETSFTLSPRPNPTAFDRTPSTTRVARR